MGRLFLRLYSILVLAVALYFVGIANLNNILHSTLERYYGDLARGTFHLLEERFKELPVQQWQALIDEVNRGDGYKVRLRAERSLTLPASDTERLNRRGMVVSSIDGASYSYARVLNSEWVLEFPFEQSEYVENQRLSTSTFNLLEMQLLEQPQSRWQEIIAQSSARFGFPVALLSLEHIELPSPMKESLVNGEIVWHKIDHNTDYLYRQIKHSPFVIMLGPFEAPLTLSYLNAILILALGLLVACAVVFWVYPLWRDLKQLGVSAEAFGQGDFSVRAPLPKRSVLHALATTFNGMADRIQGLISSHKELTNAVSHELRTPIARLRFGMEMLQTSANETDRSRFMTSMNADIDELDQLVSELLTYARFDRDRPALKFQRQPIEPWLKEVIKQAQVGNDDLPIDYHLDEKLPPYANFEPRLMARALGNLLQNGRRYAQTRIQVTFTHHNHQYQIYVDDDGPGIPKHEQENIFQAFKRLDASRDRDTGGYGLGLAIVQRISQWHGGVACVSVSPLGGARFIISWPESALSTDTSVT